MRSTVNKDEETFALVSVTWNQYGWKKIDNDSNSNFDYVERGNLAHEHLNFNFNKQHDTQTHVHGYITAFRKNRKLRNDGKAIIFFISTNNDAKERNIVGIYGNVKQIKTIYENVPEYKTEGGLVLNMRAQRQYSLLFSTYLDAKKYEIVKSMGQTPIRYIDKSIATEIIHDAINKHDEQDHKKLSSILNIIQGAQSDAENVVDADELIEAVDKPKSNNIKPDAHDSPYSIKDIIDDGCFVDKSKLESILKRLQQKKNLILQGPPGTGKTYLAKKLAYALIGMKSHGKIKVFQFHPNISYEDFIRGWRPGDDGLELVDGPFLKTINNAKSNPNDTFVMVIEEINRGNPANIFGEMLTLLEADKRKQKESITLSYAIDDAEQVYIPSNLYIIGTMNVADRSIAMVDMALRRRFSFVNLEPVFNDTWSKWVNENCGINIRMLNKIKDRLKSLNKTITSDRILGPNYMIGHSYVTPHEKITDTKTWFEQVVEYEIGPLLSEYWFEDSNKVLEEKNKLLAGLDN